MTATLFTQQGQSFLGYDPITEKEYYFTPQGKEWKRQEVSEFEPEEVFLTPEMVILYCQNLENLEVV